MEYDLRVLAFPLPEDIRRLKDSGAFDTCRAVIQKRIADARTPEVLRARLLLELEILDRLPEQFPFSYMDALRKMQEEIRDFEMDELEELRQEDACDWIYQEGSVYFGSRFFENIVKTRPEYTARLLHPEPVNEARKKLLDDNMHLMEEAGMRTVHHHLKTELRLSKEAEARLHGKKARIYMPLPVEYQQVHNYRLNAVSPKPLLVAGPQYPQRTVVFEAVIEGGERFCTDMEFDNVTPYLNPDPEKVLSQQPTFYTEELPPHIRFTPFLRALCAEIVGTETNPLKKAWLIYDYVTKNIVYSFVRSYCTFDCIPEYVASSRKGDCGFQALLFITLCRIAGVPARWQSGLYATPYDVGPHDWAEYYVAPFGWLFADCSFGGSAHRLGNEKRRRFYRCNLDPYRIPYASEFQHGFVLSEGAYRSDPYDNQVGEVICEGKALLPGEFETTYVHEAV